MFNNKGPAPLVVSPTFFNLSGERLQIPDITIPATSYLEVNMRELLTEHLPQFGEGSLQVTHYGMRLQLGAQFKIIKQGILFDEQFITPATRFPSARMESVWWMPSSSETKFILSNTTDKAVTAIVKVDGTAPRQQQPATIQLNPHQTRVLDILRDLIGHQNGTVHKIGGISITHNGTPGAIMARMLISEDGAGFSSVVNFVDPTNQRSSKLNGGGLRLGSINGDELEQIIVARNVGDEQTIVKGRIPYTNENGDVEFIAIPGIQLNPGEIDILDVKQTVRQANIPADVTFAGLELEYTTAPGSVVMNALSVSRSGQQVFQLPLLDPERMPSSAGGFPWKVDDDYTTVVFIKNETDAQRRIVARLTYEGGEYTLGVKKLKPGQTIKVDFKELRDKQTPDFNGQTIPPYIEKGQIAWTMLGGENNKISGRSEQVNTIRGISSTYACYNCCPDGTNSDGSIGMFEAAPVGYPTFEIDDTLTFGFMVNTINCYGDWGPSFLDYGENWLSSNTIAASIESGGFTTALDVGDTYLSGQYQYYTYSPSWGLNCSLYYSTVGGGQPISVIRPNVSIAGPSSAIDGTTVTFTADVRNGTPTGYQWSFTAPSGAGNNPQVNFTAPTGATTDAKAHWFAYPNRECPATSTGSTYKIKLTVTFSDRSPITKEKSFTVTVPDPAGYVAPPTISGGPSYGFSPQRNLWVITGPGSMQRVASTRVINVPTASQFFNKVEQHELKHEEQYATGMLSDLYTVSSLFSVLSTITGTSETNLISNVNQATTNWYNQQNSVLQGRLPAAEKEAYIVSDPIAPRYIYQNCGRF